MKTEMNNGKNGCLKNVLFHFVFLFISLSSSLALAQGCIPIPMDIYLMPYIGVTGQGRYIQFAEDFGNKVFKRDYPEVDIYLGLKFNDYFGIEGGYKISTTETLVSSLPTGDIASGFPVIFGPEVHRGTASFKGWHGDLVGFLPIMLPDCVYLLGSIGFNRIEVFARDKLVQNQQPPNPPQAFLDGTNVNTFSKTQTILTLGTGLQIQLDDKSSIRFKIGYENTSSVKSITDKEEATHSLRLKDSFTYGIGIVINFL